MSSEDYDELARLFEGTWKWERDENLEAFMVAAEMPDDIKEKVRGERLVILTREGDSIVEKSFRNGVEYNVTIKLNVLTEWKDKGFHLTVLPTFKDGVWAQEITPLNPGGGKRHVFTMTVHGDEARVIISMPDHPGITARRVFKKC